MTSSFAGTSHALSVALNEPRAKPFFEAIGGFGGTSVGMRLLNGLFALGFLGYAVYLFFFFEGGEFRMFWYAFVLPLILIIQAIRNRKANATAS